MKKLCFKFAWLFVFSISNSFSAYEQIELTDKNKTDLAFYALSQSRNATYWPTNVTVYLEAFYINSSNPKDIRYVAHFIGRWLEDGYLMRRDTRAEMTREAAISLGIRLP